jgi:hypothetical protein
LAPLQMASISTPRVRRRKIAPATTLASRRLENDAKDLLRVAQSKRWSPMRLQ